MKISHKKKIPPKPWQWAAPEVLSQLNPYFHQGADIWSYGVLVWEIFTLGNQPYEELGDEMPADFVSKLRHHNLRLPKPELASEKLYKDTMLLCWSDISFDRPRFSAIVNSLLQLTIANPEHGEVYS